MNSVALATLASWHLDWHVIGILLITAGIYLRGWLRGRRLIRDPRDITRLNCFLFGLVLVFIATESPLDSFDTLFLFAHMTQHLLLLMLAPALILLGYPALPLLRGLPKSFTKEALGPFLTWTPLRAFFHRLTSPAVTWIVFAASTILWHVPSAYELALGSRVWHGFQHASFFWTGILFWWPIIRPGLGNYRWPEWVGIPYLLLADLVNTALSALFVFSGKLLYPTYSAIHFSGMSPAEDQTLAGAIMWVPGSIVYLIPAVVLAMRVLSPPRRVLAQPVRVRGEVPKRFGIRTMAHWRSLAQVGMLAIALVVMIDGFFGTPAAPANLAGVLPWIHWRAFTILGLIVIGNLFCFTCPFIYVRDWARKILPARARWPRVLRTKWISAGLLVVYFWTYEAYSVWDSPYLTAWIVAGYFLGAVLIDGFFRGASFCKYVCPIGQFNFVTSLISPREVRIRKQSVCESCRTYDCIKGNTEQRGCETYLFQPKKMGNFDCTFCLDCVKACPHENVSLIQIAPGSAIVVDPPRSSIGRLSKRWDWAAVILIIVFAAFVNAAGMISPVMTYQQKWHARLGSMPFVIGLFVAFGLIILPGVLAMLLPQPKRYAYALVPVGVGMWAAHLLFHFLSYTGDASPQPIELLLLDAGLLGSLYFCWRISRELKGAPAWSMIACALYAVGFWILLQPMQMRGMMM